MRSTTSSAAIGAALFCALSLPSIARAQAGHEHRDAKPAPGDVRIPESMRAEHAEIHAELERATKAPGRVGAAARDLAKILHPHFVREEQIALPPLGLLEPLSRGVVPPDAPVVLAMTDSLRAELPRMLDEHKAIHAATLRMGEVARAQGNTRVASLATKLAMHARSEEEMFYPAAILVGDVLRTKGVAVR